MLQDLRYGWRTLWKRPGFTIVIILTLALGIGANTAIFSVVDAVLLRPLPFPNPDELVLTRIDLPGRQVQDVGMSPDELRDLQERSGVFAEISAAWPIDANLTGADRPERIELLGVSPNYFTLLGAKPQLGRIFGPEDRSEGFAEGVVISDSAWRRFFGADPNILGRKVRADSDIYTVVGVMPPGFRHPGRTLRDQVDIWATAGYRASPFPPPTRSGRFLPGAIGRLKPGLRVGEAQTRLDAFSATLRSEFPNDYPAAAGWEVKLLPSHDTMVGNHRATLLVLLGAVGLVLVIGCVNIANLLLARSTTRQREMAIRLAMGAGPRRVVRQLLTESLLLAALGSAAALLLQSWVLKLLMGFVPADLPRLHEVGFSASVLIFGLVTSLLTGLLFGVVPAWQASRTEIVATVKEGAPGVGTSARYHRFRSALVIGEVALCLVLLIGGGLLVRSFARVLDVKPGFDPTNVLVSRIWLPVPNNPELDPYRPPAKRVQFAKEVLRRVSALPGVRHAALSGGNAVPLIGLKASAAFTIEDQPDPESTLPRTQTAAVSPDYFRVLGTPLLRGRFFVENEPHPSVLIDEAMRVRYWPNDDPIGRRLKFGRRDSPSAWMTVVGVVGTIKTDGIDKPEQPHLYTSMLQGAGYAMAVYVRTDGDPSALTQSVREQVQAVDPDLPLFGEQTMASVVAASLAQRRFAVQVVALFGVLALLLAGVGIYGVMAYTVSQRTREIGIRIALGATQGAILRWVLTQGLRMTMVGVGVGLVVAFAMTRLLRGMLFGVAPTDPVTFVGFAALLAVVAMLACYMPARRATRVDPTIATST
jgi:putative ABC transport system permease protein